MTKPPRSLERGRCHREMRRVGGAVGSKAADWIPSAHINIHNHL